VASSVSKGKPPKKLLKGLRKTCKKVGAVPARNRSKIDRSKRGKRSGGWVELRNEEGEPHALGPSDTGTAAGRPHLLERLKKNEGNYFATTGDA